MLFLYWEKSRAYAHEVTVPSTEDSGTGYVSNKIILLEKRKEIYIEAGEGYYEVKKCINCSERHAKIH